MSPLTITFVVVGSVALVVIAFLIWDSRPVRKSRAEVCATLRAAAQGQSDWFEWDYFVSVSIRDPELDRVRQICWNELHKDYTPTEEDDEHGMFADPAIQERLRELIRSLERSP